MKNRLLSLSGPVVVLTLSCALSCPGQATATKTRLVPDTRSVGFLHQRPYESLKDRDAALKTYYEQIKYLPFDYGRVGSVLEALAYVHFVTIYPEEDFEVIPSVSYHDAEGRTAGELDISVFEQHTGEAVLVAECKLSKHLPKSGQLARKQLARFKQHIDEGLVANLTHEWPSEHVVQPRHFIKATTFARIGSRGALEAGYAFEADLAREEADTLQKWLQEDDILSPNEVSHPAGAASPINVTIAEQQTQGSP